MAEYKLTYFDSKGGLAEPMRYMFALAKVPFEDVRIPYTIGQPAVIPLEIKQKLPYGQVPTLEYGDTTLSQSGTITRFIARKFNFMGANELEAAKIDELSDALKDYASAWRGVFFAKGEERETLIKKAVEEAGPKYLTKFTQVLEKNGSGWLVGKSVSVADILIVHFLSNLEVTYKINLLDAYPSLRALVNRLEALPEIKEWNDKHPYPK